MNFFTMPAPPPAPAAIDVPAAPVVPAARVPELTSVKLDVPDIAPPAVPVTPPVAGTGVAGASAGKTGVGAGAANGAGVALGPGTGGEGDYIFVASPRTAILPPLAKVPGTVAGHTYRIRFWVAADGRVTRVEIDPPMPDEAYRREFLDRMMAYRFYPARSRDGASIASVVTVPLRIGN